MNARATFCPAAEKLRRWLAAGAQKRLTLTPEDFVDGEFSLVSLLFSGRFSDRLRQRWRSFCAYLGRYTPFSGWKIFWYRRAGVCIGKDVYIAPGAELDLLFPQLITLEDCAVLGLGAVVVAHIYTPDRIVIGRATVRKKGLVGGRAILAASTIGEQGVLAANSYTVKPIPAGHVAIGVPATIQKRKSTQPPTGETQDA
jgi:acetyltransferase-like isoleucine patch superfamily enzyme